MFFFLLASNSSFGQQNLILNGDFEEYWECPDDETQIERCKNVYNPLYYPPPAWTSTSDYFNECSLSPLVNVPNTAFGFQQAKSGSGFVGLIISEINTSFYNEYIQLEFLEELKNGNTYHMSVFCNIANIMEYTTKNIQFKFVLENDDYTTFLSEFMDPDYRNNLLLTDTLNWTEISFDYIAKGGEKYVIIGNFDSPDNTEFEFLYDLPFINNPNYSYFCFDDASIIEVDVSINIPNVFSPNGDNINDTLNILQGGEQIERMFILNRWGEKVYDSKANLFWDGRDQKGNELVEGVYFVYLEPKYFKEEKKDQYQEMVHLIR